MALLFILVTLGPRAQTYSRDPSTHEVSNQYPHLTATCIASREPFSLSACNILHWHSQAFGLEQFQRSLGYTSVATATKELPRQSWQHGFVYKGDVSLFVSLL